MSATQTSTSTASSQDDALPTSEQLSAANAASIFDNKGNPFQFSSLLEDAKARNLPLVLVFTRHFHCGMCKDFVKHAKQSSFLTDPSRVSVVIVGPGQAVGIDHYKASVDSPPFSFYADPDLNLYHALGVTKRSLDLGDSDKIGSHHQSGFVKGLVSSIGETVKSGSLILKGGDFKQLGGEFVWNKDGEVVWAHRMKHTRDHSEISELEKAASQA